MIGNKVEEMECWDYELAQAPKASAADTWPSLGKGQPIMERDTSTTLRVKGNPVMGIGRVGNAPQTLHQSRCAAILHKGDLRSERLNIGLSLVGVSLQWVVPSSGGGWRFRSLRLHKRTNQSASVLGARAGTTWEQPSKMSTRSRV